MKNNIKTGLGSKGNTDREREMPTNLFTQVFETEDPELYHKMLKIIQKPFYLKNPKQQILWNQLLQTILTPYREQHATSARIEDEPIFTALHQYMNQHYYPIYGYPDNESHGRSMAKVLDLQQLLSTLQPIPPVERYVDIGCSEGGITAELGAALGCRKENVFGIDILSSPDLAAGSFGSSSSSAKIVHNQNFQYLQVHPETQTLPLPDESVCLVTAIMSLHHISQAEFYLQEIFRMLKPGGILIIQEHDIATEQERLLLDILHGMYCMVWAPLGKQEDSSFCNNFLAFYKSKHEWDSLLSTAGFHPCNLPTAIEFKSIPRNNVHHNFWAIYQKTRDPLTETKKRI